MSKALGHECYAPLTRGPPVLLCNAGFYGTLAAVRALGRAGVEVTTADPSYMAPASWSKHAARFLRSPPFEQTEPLAEWLHEFGRSEPGHALYATSDDVSFALAIHRDTLSSDFALYQPDLDTMMRILDKGVLLEHARAVGIEAPETWLPRSGDEVDRVARLADGPILVKPRTQVSLRHHAKGAVSAPGVSALRAEYERFVRHSVYGAEMTRRFPEATQPMLQRYHPEGMKAIYSLSGFRDRSGKHIALLAANKVLQRPRRLGIGLCFESARVDPDLASRVARLCERIGYYGVFELEFIRCAGRSLLIDMNARFYNQIAFDVARGLQIPQLAYAAAIGDEDAVRGLVGAVPSDVAPDAPVFCNRFGFEVMVRSQRLIGAMSRDEAARWQEWRAARGRKLVDAVADEDDPHPLACEVANQLYQYIRHPRAFAREIGLGLAR